MVEGVGENTHVTPSNIVSFSVLINPLIELLLYENELNKFIRGIFCT